MLRNASTRGTFIITGNGISGRRARNWRSTKAAMPAPPRTNHPAMRGERQALLAPTLKPTRTDGNPRIRAAAPG